MLEQRHAVARIELGGALEGDTAFFVSSGCGECSAEVQVDHRFARILEPSPSQVPPRPSRARHSHSRRSRDCSRSPNPWVRGLRHTPEELSPRQVCRAFAQSPPAPASAAERRARRVRANLLGGLELFEVDQGLKKVGSGREVRGVTVECAAKDSAPRAGSPDWQWSTPANRSATRLSGSDASTASASRRALIKFPLACNCAARARLVAAFIGAI